MRAGNITEECIFNDISSHNKFFLCSLKLSRSLLYQLLATLKHSYKFIPYFL